MTSIDAFNMGAEEFKRYREVSRKSEEAYGVYRFDRTKMKLIEGEKLGRAFDICTDNEKRASKVLTTDFINFLREFLEKYDIKFELFFKDKIYIKFYTEAMFVNCYMFSEDTEKFSIPQYYVITKFAKELVEKLDSNQ